MKRVAAGAHFPTPWLFEPAKRPDDRDDYCLDCSILPQWKHQMAQASFEPGTSRSRVLRCAAAPHWLGVKAYDVKAIINHKESYKLSIEPTSI